MKSSRKHFILSNVILFTDIYCMLWQKKMNRMVYLLISSEGQLSENEMSEDNVSVGEVSDN
jgi:hypothetical protein